MVSLLRQGKDVQFIGISRGFSKLGFGRDRIPVGGSDQLSQKTYWSEKELETISLSCVQRSSSLHTPNPELQTCATSPQSTETASSSKLTRLKFKTFRCTDYPTGICRQASVPARAAREEPGQGVHKCFAS